MPLPPELDQKIRDRFDGLIAEANELIPKMQAYGDEYDRRMSNSGVIGRTNYGHVSEFQAFAVKLISLTHTLLGDSARGREVAGEIKDRRRTPLTLNTSLARCRVSETTTKTASWTI